MRNSVKILIVGLGQIGYSNAEYISKLGYEVHGYDISKSAVKRALDNNIGQRIPHQLPFVK